MWVLGPSPASRLTAEELAEVGTTFFDGGTDFVTAFTAAIKLIAQQKSFKKKQISSSLQTVSPIRWVDDFLKQKKKSQCSVVAVKLGISYSPALRRIADEMVLAGMNGRDQCRFRDLT